MRGSDLTMVLSGEIVPRGPPQGARVPQCARIANPHPDLQKHSGFEVFLSKMQQNTMNMLIFRIWEVPAVYAHIARVAPCARIAIRHPDPQKHNMVFNTFQNLVQQYRS